VAETIPLFDEKAEFEAHCHLVYSSSVLPGDVGEWLKPSRFLMKKRD
jgi:hypothetical protein